MSRGALWILPWAIFTRLRQSRWHSYPHYKPEAVVRPYDRSLKWEFCIPVRRRHLENRESEWLKQNYMIFILQRKIKIWFKLILLPRYLNNTNMLVKFALVILKGCVVPADQKLHVMILIEIWIRRLGFFRIFYFRFLVALSNDQ